MRRIGGLGLLASVTAIAAFVFTGCATMSVSSYVERGADFSAYRTWDWGPADALPTGDPRLDNNPFFQDHLQGEIERHLAGKGYVRVASGTPDLLIHYHANIAQRIDVNRVDREYGYCYADDCQYSVSEYDAGTLVIDIVDTRTNQVVWRGWAQDTMEGVIDNQDRMQKQIAEAVMRMMERLPRPFDIRDL